MVGYNEVPTHPTFTLVKEISLTKMFRHQALAVLVFAIDMTLVDYR